MDSGTKAVYRELGVYLIGLFALVAAGVAVLHELGHATLANLSGCRDISIVLFDTGIAATYARMTCPTDPGRLAMFASSFIYLAPLTVLFVRMKRFKERYLGHIVGGLAIVMAATDLQLLVRSPGLELVIAAIGGVIALYGADRLIRGIIITELDRMPWRMRPEHN